MLLNMFLPQELGYRLHKSRLWWYLNWQVKRNQGLKVAPIGRKVENERGAFTDLRNLTRVLKKIAAWSWELGERVEIFLRPSRRENPCRKNLCKVSCEVDTNLYTHTHTHTHMIYSFGPLWIYVMEMRVFSLMEGSGSECLCRVKYEPNIRKITFNWGGTKKIPDSTEGTINFLYHST